jgi:hypothetical protein
MISKERDTILKSLEEHNPELNKAFGKYIECFKILKTDIENLVSFFEEEEKDQERLADLISEQIMKHETRKNKKPQE